MYSVLFAAFIFLVSTLHSYLIFLLFRDSLLPYVLHLYSASVLRRIPEYILWHLRESVSCSTCCWILCIISPRLCQLVSVFVVYIFRSVSNWQTKLLRVNAKRSRSLILNLSHKLKYRNSTKVCTIINQKCPLQLRRLLFVWLCHTIVRLFCLNTFSVFALRWSD